MRMVSVLIAEPNLGFSVLLFRLMMAMFARVRIVMVSTRSRADEEMGRETFDVVFVSRDMPSPRGSRWGGFEGVAVAVQARARGCATFVIDGELTGCRTLRRAAASEDVARELASLRSLAED